MSQNITSEKTTPLDLMLRMLSIERRSKIKWLES